MREIFEATIATWFEESTRQLNRGKLFAALWNKDARTATAEISKLLRRTISYHDYREDFYHAFFAGVFAGAGYVVESNREHGDGRSDIVVKDYTGDRAAVFEVKYAKSLKGLEDACIRAVRQIDEKKCAEDLEADYAKVVCYGIAFFKKRCLIMLK